MVPAGIDNDTNALVHGFAEISCQPPRHGRLTGRNNGIIYITDNQTNIISFLFHV